jgi:D-alanine-D-alanine ligase
MGGQSFERDFSLSSGRHVCDALAGAGHAVVPLDTSKGLVKALRHEAADVAYIALHGRHGEDGTIQSLLELLRIPYVGSVPNVCRLAWFKPMLPHLLAGRCASDSTAPLGPGSGNLPIAHSPHVQLSADAFKEMGAAEALSDVSAIIGDGFPLAVKPARGGSALGIHKVEAFDDLAPAILDALAFDDDVLIQKWADGVELAISVVERRPGEPECLLPVEIATASGFFDREARLNQDLVDYYSPPRTESLSDSTDGADAVTRRIEDAALAAYAACGCRDLARVDLIWDGQAAHLLEIGVSPGMTPYSLFPTACAASGHDLGELLSDLLDVAVARAAGI